MFQSSKKVWIKKIVPIAIGPIVRLDITDGNQLEKNNNIRNAWIWLESKHIYTQKYRHNHFHPVSSIAMEIPSIAFTVSVCIWFIFIWFMANNNNCEIKTNNTEIKKRDRREKKIVTDEEKFFWSETTTLTFFFLCSLCFFLINVHSQLSFFSVCIWCAFMSRRPNIEWCDLQQPEQ